jgi:GNAT superfamily N-acetyltransferase
MVTIRPGQPGDEHELVRMAGNFLRSSPYGEVLPFRPEVLRALVDTLLEQGVVLVAEDRGAVLVGMIVGMAFPEPIAHEIMLDELAWWVDDEHRGSSVGPRLLAAWEAWARQHGVDLLRMVAPRGAPSVAGYYTRQGYQPIDMAFVKRLHHGTPTMVLRGVRDRGAEADLESGAATPDP